MTREEIVYFDHLATSIGDLVMAAGDSGLLHVSFQDLGRDPLANLPEGWVYQPSKLVDASRQMDEYFQGQRRTFDLALAPVGTSFQLRVWNALMTIPYGETITYGELAGMVGSPKACRAVGNANGRNPLVVIQPCHRVVASGQKLGGFSAGLFRKKFLLGLEKGVTTIY